MKDYIFTDLLKVIVLASALLFLSSSISFAQETYTPGKLFSMSLKELMDVSVEVETAGKTPEQIADIPASVVLIQRKDIERYGYSTLAEILEHIPGMYPTNDYSYDGENFGVRGFWTGVVNRNMIILVNGVNQIFDYESNFPLNSINIPVEAIDRIEVIRGPNSVIYGTGAFFGVINIITNETSDNEPTSLVTSSIGTQNTKKLMARISGKENKFQYVLNASIYSTSGIDQPLDQMMSAPADSILKWYNVNKYSRTGGKLENQEKYFDFSGKTEAFNVDFSYAETDMKQYLLAPSVSNGGPEHLENMRIAFGYDFPLSGNVFLKTKFSYHSSIVKPQFDIYVPNYDMEQEVGNDAYEIEINAMVKLNSQLDFISGLYQHSVLKDFNDLVAPSSTEPSFKHIIVDLDDGKTLDIHAFYTQFNYTPLTNLRLVAGARIEQMPKYTIRMQLPPAETQQPATILKNDYDYTKLAFIPRVAALYTISENHIIKLLYGQAINRPSFQQNIDNFFGIQGYLEPEKIQTLEINYLGSFYEGVTASISIFRNGMNDLLLRKQGFNPDGTYYSYFSTSGEMVTNGTEVTLRAEIVRNLLIDVSGTYQNTKNQQDKNIDPACSPHWLGYGSVSYQYNDVIGSITARYVDKMKAYWDPTIKNSDGTYGNRIGKDVLSYISVGANFRIENLFVKGLYFSVRGANLLNTRIFYPTYTNNPWADEGTIGLGRSVIGTIGWKF